MANRTGMGPGLAITIGLLSVATVGLFVTTVIFGAEGRKQEGLKEDAERRLQEALGSAGADATWERLRESSGNQGVVPYLADQNAALIRLIGGSPSRDTAETLEEEVAETFGADAPSLIAFAQSLETRVLNQQQRAEAALRAQQTAESSREAAFREVEQVRAASQDTRQRLEGEIDRLTTQVEAYRDSVNTTTSDIERALADAQQEYDASVAELRSELQNVEDERAQLQERVQRLSGGTESERLSPRDEEALVDALIVQVDDGADEVYISRGADSNVVLGMTFEVYGRGVSIRPDEQGNYSDGKATIEIVRINENNAVGRVLRVVRGNPILPGDRCVNAVWDPNKEYRFVVFGNFDTNFDGSATPAERQDIEAIIAEWGGTIEDELTGRTDFVILGERPILPHEPRRDDPFAVVELYLDKRDIVDRYNELFRAAGDRSIPVLNQNRLFTLTGLDDRPD